MMVENCNLIKIYTNFCGPPPQMVYKTKSRKHQAAKARKARTLKQLELETEEDSDAKVTCWTGGVNNHLIVLSDSDSDTDSEWASESSVHCELNYIEFFRGAVKRWLRDNCDYTFQGLQENLPKALESVALETIRKWEHRMYRWMDAYRTGLSARDAQFKVKQFSSKKYTSHRRVPESLAKQFD